jgi:hypothetical protein
MFNFFTTLFSYFSIRRNQIMKSFIRRSLGKSKFIPIWLFVISMLSAILLYACTLPLPVNVNVSAKSSSAPTLVSQAQTFTSNGERIYFTATSDRGTNITSTGVSSSGGMMRNGGMMGNGTQRGTMGNGSLTCASCHFSDGRGGERTMMGMQTINAPDIRWSALKDEFDNDEKFRLAITKGQDPDGKKMLNRNMPRWQIGNEDLADLIGFLKTL